MSTRIYTTLDPPSAFVTHDQPKRFTTETVYAITDLRVHQAKPAQLAGWIDGQPAGPSPIAVGAAEPGGPIEVDRLVTANGLIALAGRQHPIGYHLAGRRITARLDHGVLHILDTDRTLLRSLPNPSPAPTWPVSATPALPAHRRPRPNALNGSTDGSAAAAASSSPVNASTSTPRSPYDAPQAGIAHAGRIVTVETSDTTFRIYDGDQLLTEVARTTTKPIARFKARKPKARRPGTGRQNDRMPADDAQLSQLLHSLDDPDHLEFPANYDHHRARARFNQLAERLNRDFGGQCLVDREVQDASRHGDIVIPSLATATNHPLLIYISNFGNLAVLAVDNVGVWDDEETAQLLHPDDANRIHSALDDLGYTLIPEKLLERRYDGAAPFPADTTWWTRYFDYL